MVGIYSLIVFIAFAGAPNLLEAVSNLPAGANPECSYTISPAVELSVPVGGIVKTVTVTVPGGCSFSASSSDTSMLTVNVYPGTTTRLVIYIMKSNSTSDQRSAILAIGNQTFKLTQAAKAAPPSSSLRIFPS